MLTPQKVITSRLGGRRWVRTCTPGTAHNLARCGYFRRSPLYLLVRGRLATGVPISFGARELRKHVAILEREIAELDAVTRGNPGWEATAYRRSDQLTTTGPNLGWLRN
jgi:hypothetical protein